MVSGPPVDKLARSQLEQQLGFCLSTGGSIGKTPNA